MRPVRYNVAASLDGYVAGPHGSFDWIPDDPTVDFAGLFAKIDTVLLGRKSYEVALDMGGELPWGPDTRVFVFSSTLRPENHPEITVVADHAVERVQALREEPGDGEIWLFGGGELFRTLLAGGQVDRVEVTTRPRPPGWRDAVAGTPRSPDPARPRSPATSTPAAWSP
jgi:dihydrofolate reductase